MDHTLSGDAQTLVRSPHSTVSPRADSTSGAKILELLLKLGRPAPPVDEEAVLGQGGMGVVRLATQLPLGRKVAVKRLQPGHAARADIEALLSEAWLSGSLEHPNIVPVHELGLDADGLPVLVMKRIEGLSWSTLLRDADALAAHAPGRPALEANLRILMQVCNALHYAHARGVVHRDVKPDNVMVGGFGEVYLVDWGIAVAPGPSSQLAGTPVYMAPEMLGGADAVISARTDVYLLGAVLCELLTGRPPHDVTTHEALSSSVASMPAFPADAPAELAALAQRCMSADPAHRPQSALAVRVALEDFLAHLGSLELTAQAERRLGELQTLLASKEPEARRVFELFSECRFGFQQALRDWAHNVRARHGLDGAVKVMVRYQLESGSARTAQSLLSELVAPDASLLAEVEAAVAGENAERARLEALEKSLDPRTGGRQRMFVALGISMLWVVAPLLGRPAVVRWAGYEMLLSATVSGLSLPVLLFAAWKWRAASTPLNAQLVKLFVFAMSAQTVTLIVFHFVVGDLGAVTVPILEGYWALLAGIVAVTLVPGAWLAAVGYLGAALLSARFPEWRNETITLGNTVLVLNVAALLRKQLAR